jgi:hypothetical protein
MMVDRNTSACTRAAGPRLWPALLVGLCACTPKFDNATTISDLRLIGVQAEPPEVLIDLAALMATGTLPEPLPTITLSPLVLDPKGGGRPVAIRVEACANQPDQAVKGGNNLAQRGGRVGDTVADSPCPEGSPLLADAMVPPAPDGTVPFQTSFTPTLPFLIEAARADPLGIELGLPITITFVVSAGDERVVGYKRMLFSRRLTPEQVPNQNPVVTRFFWRARREDPRQLIDPLNPPGILLRDRVRIAVDPALAESYPARSYSTSSFTFYTEQIPEETLRYNFYATAGVFAPGTVSNDPSPLRTNPSTDLETTYEAPVDPALRGSDVDVFMVVRDERGGTSFARSKLHIE